MRYIKPNYEREAVETADILVTSPGVVDLGGGATLTEVNESTAQVGASALDVLGLR